MVAKKPHIWIDGIECKKCSKCDTVKPLDQFSKLKKHWDGLKGQCKSCDSEYHQQNRAHISNRMKIYRTANKEHISERGKKYYKSNWKILIRSLKIRHIKKGFPELSFNLTDEYLTSIVPEHCPLSNIKLEKGTENGSYNSPSLDRIDNSKGYEQDNVMFISHCVNTSKGNLTLEEWLETLINLRNACINKIWLELKPGKLEEVWYNTSNGKRPNYKKLLVNGKRSNNKRQYNKEFTITHQDIILTDYCPITGLKFKGPNEGAQSYNSITIDRIDNNLGYVPGNVWFISKKANYVKANFTLEEITGDFFANLISNIQKLIESQKAKESQTFLIKFN